MSFFTLCFLLSWITTIDFIVVVKAYNFDPSERRGVARVPGQIISGSYLVQLTDETNATNVRATAVEIAAKMQSVKQLLIANGTLSRSDIVTNTKVSPSLIFTETIKGFLMKGVSQEIYSMLLKITNVIRVEPDRVVSIYGALGQKKRHLLSKHKQETDLANPEHNRMLQSKSQVLPWGIKRIGGPIKPNPNPSGRVFIIDTGIAPLSDLNINETLSINFANWYFDPPNPLWYDGDGHGTHVAGTVAAIDNAINVVGVVPGATVVAVRVLDEFGEGLWSNIIAGIEYVASKGKVGDVANLSLGGYFIQIVNDAVEKAAAKGIKFAIAAGNSYDDAWYYSPASATGVNIYTVSCFDNTDSFCSFSNYGSVVDYSGPGKDVESLSPDGGTAILSGTSMSTPHIAGLLLAGSIKVGGYVKCDPDGAPDPIAVASFAPVSPPAAAPIPKTASSPNQLDFTIRTDYDGTEIGWSLFQVTQRVPKLIFSKVPGTYGSEQLFTEQLYLDVGKYQLNVTDDFGDGLKCPGYFSISLGGVLLKRKEGIFKSDLTNFTVTSVPANQFLLTILTDGFASEDNAWTLYQVFANKQTLIASKEIGDYDNNMPYQERLLLAAGTYQFNFTDDYGDGISRPGYYTLSLGGTIIKKSSRAFTYLDSTTFTLLAPAPTPNKPIPKPVVLPAAVKPVLPKPVPNLPIKPVLPKPVPNLPIKPVSKPAVLPAAVKPVLPK